MVPEPNSPAAPAAEPPSEDRSGNAFSRHVSRVADRLDERWPYAAVPLVLSVLLNGGVGGFALALVVASPVGLVCRPPRSRSVRNSWTATTTRIETRPPTAIAST